MTSRHAAALLVVLVTAGCRSAGGTAGTQIVQPGAPGETNRVLTPEAASDLSKVQATPADVKFMQGMIGHHAQAIEMTDLIASRTSRDQMKLLGQRIAVSQADEMNMMRTWLKARGQEVPAEHAHHMPGGMMPGMLTPEQMAELTAATGEAFDKLFLRYMIQHHEGAVSMVKELFDTPGAAQDPSVFKLASDVSADQTTEIARMRKMLATMTLDAAPR